MIRVKRNSFFQYQVLVGLLVTSVTVSANCNESMQSAVSVDYEVHDEYAAAMQEAPGKPQGVRGIETRQLIVADNQSYERSIGRFWRLDEDATLKKLKEFSEKMRMGEMVAGMPKDEFHLVHEDKVVIITPNRYIYYDNIAKKGFERERDDPVEFLSNPEARKFLKDLIAGEASESDAKFAGKKRVLGQECRVVKSTRPFNAEICFFEFASQPITLEEKINIFGEHVYTQKATKLDLAACVSQEVFDTPDWMSVS